MQKSVFVIMWKKNYFNFLLYHCKYGALNFTVKPTLQGKMMIVTVLYQHQTLLYYIRYLKALQV